MPKHCFAFAPSETVVDVPELVKEDPEARGLFRCAGCGDPVIPRPKDNQRVKHFAHEVRQGHLPPRQTGNRTSQQLGPHSSAGWSGRV